MNTAPKNALAGIAASAMILTGVACTTAQSDSTSSRKPASVQETARPVLGGSRVHAYTSVSELWQASEVLVTAHVDSIDDEHASVEKEPDAAPYFEVTLVVDTIAAAQAGSVLKQGESIVLHQIGALDADAPEVIPVLASGTEYALFLDRFELEPGKPTDRWVIAGATGAYRLDGSVNGGTKATHLDPVETGLPQETDLEHLTQAASGTPG